MFYTEPYAIGLMVKINNPSLKNHSGLRPLHNSLCEVFRSVDGSQRDRKSRIGRALLAR